MGERCSLEIHSLLPITPLRDSPEAAPVRVEGKSLQYSLSLGGRRVSLTAPLMGPEWALLTPFTGQIHLNHLHLPGPIPSPQVVSRNDWRRTSPDDWQSRGLQVQDILISWASSEIERWQAPLLIRASLLDPSRSKTLFPPFI